MQPIIEIFHIVGNLIIAALKEARALGHNPTAFERIHPEREMWTSKCILCGATVFVQVTDKIADYMGAMTTTPCEKCPATPICTVLSESKSGFQNTCSRAPEMPPDAPCA